MLLTLLAAARVGFVICVPGADDVMLGYQSLGFHDALYARDLFGTRPAPEFEEWLTRCGLMSESGRVLPVDPSTSVLRTLGAGA